MVRWARFALVGLVVSAVAGLGVPSAVAEGVRDEQQAAACAGVLDALLPGLVPTSSVCSVNVVGQGPGGS